MTDIETDTLIDSQGIMGLRGSLSDLLRWFQLTLAGVDHRLTCDTARLNVS